MASKKVGRGNYGTQTPGARAGDAMEQVMKDIGEKGKSEGHRVPLSLDHEIGFTASTLPNKRTDHPNMFSLVETGRKSRNIKKKSYRSGGVETKSANTISNKDAMTMALEDVKDKAKAVFKGKAKDEGTRPGNGSSSANTISNRDVQTLKDAKKKVKSANTISNRDVQFLKDAKKDVKDKMKAVFKAVTAGIADGPGHVISSRDEKFLKDADKKKTPKSEVPSYRRNNAKGGVASYAHGGVEAADKEGSRLSISMERQEDAGYSPSEADFDQQHRLAAEGIMEVGADVTTIQGHNSRASLGETEGVRGTGAMVKGTKFDGVF